MSFYDDQAWAASQGRQQPPSWNMHSPVLRPTDTPASPSEQSSAAFLTQYEEIDRATDNLMKSGKFLPGMPGGYNGPVRRDSFPVQGRGFHDHEPRVPASEALRRQFNGEPMESMRPGSSTGVQGFYASQRFQHRHGDQDPAMQNKRRIAAQRERELRNYHQEQQYSRNSTSAKTDRPLSPPAMLADDRRELIARQHRAAFGQDGVSADGSGNRPQDTRAAGPMKHGRVASPLAYDAFSGSKHQQAADAAAQLPQRDQTTQVFERRTSTSPPSASRSNFGIGETAASSGGNSAASPLTSPSLGPGNMPSIAAQGGIAPIGSRPPPGVSAAKPLALPKERSTSASSNPAATDKNAGLGGWGSSSGGWGASKNSLGVQTSVWA